jgi:hypothetical protein
MGREKRERGRLTFSGLHLVDGVALPGPEAHTLYSHVLDNWTAFYPEEQIFVGFLEDIHFHPGDFLRRLCRFLGVSARRAPKPRRRKIHGRSAPTVPTRVVAKFAAEFREESARLAERFGGYADFWLFCAERLAEGSVTEESLPYPLWESPLWTEWADEQQPHPGSREAGPQSGPLVSIGAR